MKRQILRAVLALVLTVQTIALGSSAEACSIFRMPLGTSTLVGRNFDWDYGHGLIVVNKRGVAKAAIPLHTTDSVQWVSKYGSLTFNQAGRELPYGGVNEKGLMIEVLWLGFTSWPTTTAPSINETQWIQYQLDMRSSVKDLIAHIDDVRILSVFAKVHFFACDASGECATIEGAGGVTPEIHTGGSLPIPALTNNTYDSSKTFARSYLTAGTCATLAPGSMRSLDRFARAACAISQPPAPDITSETARANAILNDVAQGSYTTWQIVYNLSSRTISMRTALAPQVKTVSLDAFDLSCGKPAQILDLNYAAAKAGADVSGFFADYNVAANRAIVEKSLLNGFATLPQETVDKVVAFPDMTACVAP